MAVAAIGFFDGVHLGHRLVLETLLSEAERRGERSLIITFWPHPRLVLDSGAESLRLLTTKSERLSLLEQVGPSEIITEGFDSEFASMSAEEYLGRLRCNNDLTAIVAGYDTRLGSDRKGPEELEKVCARLGLDCVRVPEFPAPVSSTRIRAALSKGNVESASEMLGYRFGICGHVVHGNKIGRTLGFPTANLGLLDPVKAVPAPGAYLTEVLLGEEIHYGMTNVGVRPTVGESSETVIETNIFDFDEEIYGRQMTLRFVRRVRAEVKFPGLDALRAQLLADRRTCNDIIDTL